MKLKTFENFDNDNSKIWIIGIPSGEALQVSRHNFDNLYAEGLLNYNTKYVDIGFYAFDDEDVEVVRRYVDPKVVTAQPRPKRDVMIFKNDYDEILMDAILGIIDQYPANLEIYVQDESMGITYGPQGVFYIEITMDSHGSKYHLIKRYKGQVQDKYNIGTDSLLLNRIYHELNV